MVSMFKIFCGCWLMVVLLLAGCTGRLVRIENVESKSAQIKMQEDSQLAIVQLPDTSAVIEVSKAEQPVSSPNLSPPIFREAVMSGSTTKVATVAKQPLVLKSVSTEEATPARRVEAASQPATGVVRPPVVAEPAPVAAKPSVSTADAATDAAVVSPLLLFGTGLGLLLLVIVIILFIPRPVGLQVLVLRTSLALAAASIAASIPGFIKIETKFLSAGMLQGEHGRQ